MERRKIVWTFAMAPEVIVCPHRPSSAPAWCRTVSAVMMITEAQRLKMMWTTPVRLASAFEPMEQTMAVVTQSPMFTPMMMA